MVLCDQAVVHGFAAVCVNPWLVRYAAEALAGTRTAVCSVAGFPLGAATAWAKSTEAQGAIADGAGEVDLVINIGALKSGETKILDEELSLVRRSIGDALLMAHWVDLDFDPELRAFYYVRVIEIPKPRWTAYDAKFFKIKMPKEVPMTVQDRAYTSPIWYTP